MLLICLLYVGPIPDNNPGWKLAIYAAALATGARYYDIKAVDIAVTPLLNPAVVLNKENTGVYVASEYTKDIVTVC
jgi:hypothetical protein